MKRQNIILLFCAGMLSCMLMPILGAHKDVAKTALGTDRAHDLVAHCLRSNNISIDQIVVDNVDAKACDEKAAQLAEDRKKQTFTKEKVDLSVNFFNDLMKFGKWKWLAMKQYAKLLAEDREIKNKIRRADRFSQEASIRFLTTIISKYIESIVRGGEIEMLEKLDKLIEFIPGFLHDLREKNTGNNLLHIAAESGQEEIVIYLITEGIDPLALNAENKTASQVTTHTGIQRLLQEAEYYALKERQIQQEQYDALMALECDLLTASKKKKDKKLVESTATAVPAANPSYVADAQGYADLEQAPSTAATAATTSPVGMLANTALDGSWQVISAPFRLSAHAKKINGRDYTAHALERMALDTPSVREKLATRALNMGLESSSKAFKCYVNPRAISAQEVEDVIAKATRQKTFKKRDDGVTIYSADSIKIVLNAKGAVITVMRTA